MIIQAMWYVDSSNSRSLGMYTLCLIELMPLFKRLEVLDPKDYTLEADVLKQNGQVRTLKFTMSYVGNVVGNIAYYRHMLLIFQS